MAYNFIPWDRAQSLLMPPNMLDWLPKGHLVWFVIDSVAELDLSAFYARYRQDGWGRAAYDPAMMVTLLLYAYASGIRSAREIERRCGDDVAVRVITVNQVVDHATICRFRSAHREALGKLFVSVLGLCSKAGMVRPEVVAIDGTKLAANASAEHNVTREQLESYARKVFDEAERVDAREDELYGEGRGDEIPEHLREQATRLEWLRGELKKVEAERASRDKRLEERAAKERELGRSLPGRKPKPKELPPARVNVTDPDSRIQKTPKGYIQGYNGQLAVTADQVIVAADLTSKNNDVGQLDPMLRQAQANLEQVEVDASIGTVVADAGYFSEDNANLDAGAELLIAPVKGRKLKDAIAARKQPGEPSEHSPRRWRAEHAVARIRADRRPVVMQAYGDGFLTPKEAAEALGLSTQALFLLGWRWRRSGHLSAAKLPAPPRGPTPTEVMLERFAQPGRLEKYGLRAQMVEPVFGQLKEPRRFRRLLHRGMAACRCEFRMMAAAHNLRKMWTRRHSSPGMGPSAA